MRGAVHEWSSFDICAYKPHFRFDLQGWSRSKRPGLTVHPGGPRLRPGARRVLVSEIGLRVYSFRHESLLTFDGGGGANDNKFISSKSNWRGRHKAGHSVDNVNEHDNRDNPGDGDKTRRPGKLLAKKNEPGFRSAAGTTASGHQRAGPAR